MAKVDFKYGTQAQYDAASKEENAIYCATQQVGAKQAGSIYKGGEIVGSTVTDKLYTDSSVTVTGVTVGNFKDGDVIAPGTSVSEILQKMLMKEIDVTATKPTATLNLAGTPTAGSYEAGTAISVTPTHSYTDGKFVGQSGYSYNVAAGCAEGTTIIKKGNEVIQEGEVQSFTLAVETVKFASTTTYGASTVTPKTNFGNNSKVTIPPGTTVESSKSFTGYANNFIVHVADNTTPINSALIRSGNKYKEEVASANYNAPAGTMRTIVATRKATLTSASGNLGANITASFIKEADTIKVDGATAAWQGDYYIYVYSRPALSEQETINITF